MRPFFFGFYSDTRGILEVNLSLYQMYSQFGMAAGKEIPGIKGIFSNIEITFFTLLALILCFDFF